MPHPALPLLPRIAGACVAVLGIALATGSAVADGWSANEERPPRLGQFVFTAPNGNGINYLLPPGEKAIRWSDPASVQLQQMGRPVPSSATSVDESACARKYRSYDPASGLYRTSDGRWKPCPPV